ncbi:hypothetical protein [Microcoleus asticus]|uniref:hypothetical protein n=1 Tax=Microcoleus asticus TaxID=2815231 RepID=UPI00155263F2|nr:hypothetical protein [Microcoleus asticus]
MDNWEFFLTIRYIRYIRYIRCRTSSLNIHPLNQLTPDSLRVAELPSSFKIPIPKFP